MRVPEFLKRTGLTYCEFIALWQALQPLLVPNPDFITFTRSGVDPKFPDCEPCCADDLVIAFVLPVNPEEALTRLAVFIRLWRTLRTVHNAHYSFADLRDICFALRMFNGNAVNADFIRQLAAFQMLRDDLGLSLGETPDVAPAIGADRLRLLALWSGGAGANWDWAIQHLLRADRGLRGSAPQTTLGAPSPPSPPVAGIYEADQG